MCRVKAGLEHKQQPVKPEKRGPLDIPDTGRRCGKGEEENPFNEQTAAAHCKAFPFLLFYPPFSFFSPSRPESRRVGRHFQVLFLFQPTGKGPQLACDPTAIMLPGTLIWGSEPGFNGRSEAWTLCFSTHVTSLNTCGHIIGCWQLLPQKSLTMLILLKLFHALRTQVLV